MHCSVPVRSLVLALALTTGCFGGTEPPLVDSLPVFIVSKPVAGSPAAHAGAAFSSAGPADLGTVYVSLPPGVAPSGVAATIRNHRSGSEAAAFLFAGGFDPVGIAAGAGDTLELEVHGADGSTVLSALATVPAARRPVIVRSSPPPKKRDVPLNSVVVVVFSEPIDPQSLTAGSVQLVAGTAVVSGHITLSADGLRAEFVPDQLLQPSTTYTLALTSAVADLAGELLEPSTSDFTTASSAAGVGMSQIAFTGCPLPGSGAAVCGIFVMNADGSDVRQLSQPLSPGDNDHYPTWSPDGRKIAVRSFRHCALSGRTPGDQAGGCRAEIYVMNADGSDLTKVTDIEAATGLSAIGPAWSPDGRTIAFSTLDAVYAVNADGSGLRELTASPALRYGNRPAWSPDGARIAFLARSPKTGASGPLDSGGVWVMNADGSNIARITGVPLDGFPSWSPDGTRIAFQRDVSGGPASSHIHVVNADGLNEIQLTAGLGLEVTPTWSPDGTQIAFKRYAPDSAGVFGPASAGINVMRADGSGAVRLISGYSSGYSNVYTPAWSPVGAVPALPTASYRTRR